jgi:hypothetical protein
MNRLLQLQLRAVTDVSFEEFRFFPPIEPFVLRLHILSLVLGLSFCTSRPTVTDAILHVPRPHCIISII